jgi:hypothetical protein
MSGSEPVIRPFRDGDEVAVNEGFNRVFGLDRSLSEWRWKFPAVPEGRWIMLAEDTDGRLLAHYGAAPMRLQVGGLVVRAGQPVDVYSTPEARRTKVFTHCYRAFIEAFGNQNDLPLMYGFPGGVHYEMGLTQLAYEALGPVGYWHRAVGRSGRVWLPRYRVVRGFDPDAADQLWARARVRYPVAGIRDASWLSRRFTGRPGVEYVFLTAKRRTRVVALAVVRILRERLLWADLIWDGQDPRALVELDHAADAVGRRSGCTKAELWLRGDDDAAARLTRLGWSAGTHPEDLRMVARAFHPDLDPRDVARRVYVTMGDSDLV